MAAGEDIAYLAIEMATIDLSPADNSFVVGNTKLAVAIVTNSQQFVRAGQTSDQNGEIVGTNSDVEDTSVETEDGRHISGNGLFDILGIASNKSDTIATTKIGIDQFGIKRILIFRAWEEAVK